MKKSTLIETNRYLRDANMRAKYNERAIDSSFGVEGIKIPSSDTPSKNIPIRQKKLFEKFKSKFN